MKQRNLKTWKPLGGCKGRGVRSTPFVRGLTVGLGAILLFVLGFPSPSPAAPGDLDPTFGTGGKVITAFAFGRIRALVLQPDGKLVAAGTAGDFALARYNPDGSLDPTFGSGGQVLTDFTPFGSGLPDEALALALQPDGKLVAAGTAGANFALARYNPDGSLDPTFGSGGQVITDFGGGDEARALALQPDGKIVAAGESLTVSGTVIDFALARYNPDGSLDPTFGGGGKVITVFNFPATGVNATSTARALVLQPDGKLVAAGRSGICCVGAFALARYNPDGSLDPTFGSGGQVLTNFDPGTGDGALALFLQPDGKLVAAGGLGGCCVSAFDIARYNPDGSLDPTFGSAGKVAGAFDGGVSALALQFDGKIIMGGASLVSGRFNFALARYNPDGSLDPTFGSSGQAITDFGGTFDLAHALALQADGKIVVAGESNASTPRVDFALARYRGDPTLFLDLTLNRAAFIPGDMLEIDTRMANSGPDTVVDEYFGALLPPEVGPAFGCPGNDAVVFVTETGGAVLACLSAPPQTFPPFAQNVTIPADLPMTVTPDFLSFVWPADAPAGTYVVFRAFIRSGAVADGSLDTGDLLALAAAGLSFTP